MPTPMAGTQAPGFFRLKVGSYEVTVLSDGGLALDAALFAGDQAGKEKCLKDAHLPTTGIPTPVNTWLVNTGANWFWSIPAAERILLRLWVGYRRTSPPRA